VAMMSRLFLREALPKYTMRALTLALIGAVLMMSGKMGSVVTETAVARNDPLGIGLAVTSAFMLAIYMILVRRSARHKVPGEALLIVHLVSLAVFSFAAGLIFREDWQQWQQLGAMDWVVFALFAGGVLLGANLGQIRSIQHLGAPLVSSMMAVRLVSALIFGGLLLQERLSSVSQVVGTAVVLVTITWYLQQQ
ncbi:MAG: EamA family transporter, partial [Anaerolineales bacterium]|nr:EamA family transporter [Anaerolineales bacterium]